MMLTYRTPGAEDWPAILAIANASGPEAPDGNRAWLAARMGFDETRHARRHYLVEDEGGSAHAYGAVEAGAGEAERFRLFLVMDPDDLDSGVGDSLFERLLVDARELGAAVLWMREMAGDALIPYATARGFEEISRVVLSAPSAGAFAGFEVVALERRLDDAS